MDLVLRNGHIVDGSGGKGYRGDVGIRDGRIVAVGKVDESAREEIDADGAVIAPGFVDCHTHYDAQVLWDPLLGPSVYHGVTTVLSGNCGFTLAPLSGRAEDADYLLKMLARVEGMPFPALAEAVKPTWRSFGEYLDVVERNVGINIAFLVGHCALRRHVMGARAVGGESTPDDIAAMAALLRESLEAGAAGFSSTISPTHSDHNGEPVPSRWASDQEILALCSVVADFPGTWLEMSPSTGGPFGDRQYDLTTAMSLAAQRPLNWNVLLVNAARPEMVAGQMRIGSYAAERGAKVYSLAAVMPNKIVINLRTGVQIELLEGWLDFINLPKPEKLAAMRDPATRRRLEAAMTSSHMRAGLPRSFADYRIEDVGSAANARWKGRTIGEYAASVGLPTFDALFQFALDEDLRLSFSPPPVGDDPESWTMRRDVWRDEHCLIGGSDAGAHVDSIDTFALPTHLLGEAVRKRGLIPLEEGVHRLTALPADAFGLQGRGRIAIGAAADIVIFDPDTIGCGPISLRDDLPAGETRLYADATGIRHVIVNGVPVVGEDGATGRLGGKVLRSGRDTVTVPLPAKEPV